MGYALADLYGHHQTYKFIKRKPVIGRGRLLTNNDYGSLKYDYYSK